MRIGKVSVNGPLREGRLFNQSGSEDNLFAPGDIGRQCDINHFNFAPPRNMLLAKPHEIFASPDRLEPLPGHIKTQLPRLVLAGTRRVLQSVCCLRVHPDYTLNFGV